MMSNAKGGWRPTRQFELNMGKDTADSAKPREENGQGFSNKAFSSKTDRKINWKDTN